MKLSIRKRASADSLPKISRWLAITTEDQSRFKQNWREKRKREDLSLLYSSQSEQMQGLIKFHIKFHIALKAMSMRRGVNLKNGFLASAARHTILFSASLRVRPFVSSQGAEDRLGVMFDRNASSIHRANRSCNSKQ